MTNIISRKEVDDKICRVCENDMDMGLMLEDLVSDYYQENLVQKLTFDQLQKEKLVEEMMQPVYKQVVRK